MPWASGLVPGKDRDVETLIDIAARRASFAQLLRVVWSAGLEVMLAGNRPFTLFAPTDSAFARLPQGILDVVFTDPPTLLEALTYHIVPGIVYAREMIHHSSLKTLHGAPLAVDAVDRITVGEARVIEADLVAGNGVIHAIDRVLLPNARRPLHGMVRPFSVEPRRESMLL